LLAPSHPLLETALARTQPTTSLQRLISDPLAFVWRDVLGWRARPIQTEPLELDPASFGELVHELISRAISRLEPSPGFARASGDEITAAIGAARDEIASTWPLARRVPPPVLWRHTVNEAARRTARGLAADIPTNTSTRSWTEVRFGQENAIPGDLPWDPTRTVGAGSYGLRYSGRIDRLDVKATSDSCQDYRLQERPRSEEQRRLYARPGP
jgi:hypothetical protein